MPNVRYWPRTDVAQGRRRVRFQGESGRDADWRVLLHFDLIDRRLVEAGLARLDAESHKATPIVTHGNLRNLPEARERLRRWAFY